MGYIKDSILLESLKNSAKEHLDEIDRQLDALTDEYIAGRNVSIAGLETSAEARTYAELLIAKSGALQALATLTG